MAWDQAFGPRADPVGTAVELGPLSGRHPAATQPAGRGHGRREHGHHGEDAKPKRQDIQGLRAVAVILVVLFHAGVGRLAGGFVGVDVFFVISGFLITGNITRALGSRGEFSLLGFYANRARRLLPAAFVAIATTCLLTYIILPASRFDDIARDGLASAYYALNWRLSAQSVDYLAQNQAPSPFQHFWSLAVEEQFYLVWPLLLLVAAAVVARRRAPQRIAFGIAMLLVLVPSLWYSVHLTSSDPSQAYFVTPTRMWELALGGLLVLGVDALARVPGLVRAALGWLGIAAIVYSAVVFTEGTPFPGSAALVPTLGAVAVIAAGCGPGRAGPVFVLGTRVPQFFGNISYSLYLWHWPLIVFAASRFESGLPLWAGLVAGFGAVIPAWLSYRYIEQPGQNSERFAGTGPGLGLGLLTSLSAALAALLLLAFIPEAPVADISVSDTGVGRNVQGKVQKVGAQTLRSDALNDPAGAPKNYSQITPDPQSVTVDAETANCSVAQLKTADAPCDFGDTTSATTVALVGDSHAGQWLPALKAMATERGWHGVVHTKASCPFNLATLALKGASYNECKAWTKAATTALLKEKPKLVIVSASIYSAFRNGSLLGRNASNPVVEQGYRDAWKPLLDAGIKVAVLADTPFPDINIPECVAQHRDDLSACAKPRADLIDADPVQQQAAKADKDVPIVDLNSAICPTTKCAAVIGGVLVYRDTNHLTDTYVSTLEPRFDSAFGALVTK